MNIAEIEKTLPCGFKDAVLRQIIVRNRSYELELHLDIQNGTYIKRGILTVIDLVYFIVDDSETDILGDIGQGIKISASGSVESLKEEVDIQGPYVEDAFRHYFYLPDYGKYMFVSGKDARFNWEE